MTDINLNKIITEYIPNQESANQLLGKLFDLTKPEAIYGEPVVSGDVTIITASEYMAGLGVGYGGGAGTDNSEKSDDETPSEGAGGGGGGGGTAVSRPVAAIIIESGHVRVEPIVDVTKISIAAFTAFGAMWMARSKMRRASRK